MISFTFKQIVQYRERIAMKREEKKEKLIEAIKVLTSSSIGKLENEIPREKIQAVRDAAKDLTSYWDFLYHKENRLISLKLERALRNLFGRNTNTGIWEGYTVEEIEPLSRMISLINRH